MYSVERIDARNITYKKAYELARLRVSALSEDVIQRNLFSIEERVDMEAVPSLTEFEALREKTNLFEAKVLRSTRLIYTRALGSARYRVYALVSDTGAYAATSEWRIPAYADPGFKVPLLQWIYAKWLEKWYSFLSYFSRIDMSAVHEAYKEADRVHGINLPDKESRVEALSKLPRHELEKTAYPDTDIVYYLDVFGVRSDYHGKGLGRQLLAAAIDAWKKEATPPPMFNGPAKLQWQAAPEARGFYRKMGCIEGETRKTHMGFEHTVFFYNIE